MTQKKEIKRGTKPKARRHGYRGYGSGVSKATPGGTIHWGKGFTGMEIPDTGSASLLEPGLFTDKEKAPR
ncbi:MAG TPA: hypothetical protein VIA45_03825 [Thermoanaerobaculia bacterium]|jgi:hypothetical protein